MTTTLLSVRPVDTLQALNAEQRSAVEHGLGRESADQRPLLIIAGAGSGKTNTLAYRVANLVQHGVDPQRILLLTFSRRAAQEMERRSSHVLQQVMGFGKEPPKLPWSGTFHAIGARLLRDYVAFIGLDESFTIHDRSDAEDLMGLVRHELGLSSTESRFPRKGTCLSIYSRVVNSQQPLGDVLRSTFPWCGAWEAELKRLFGGYVDAKQEQNALDYDDLLLFWSEMMSDPQLATEVSGRFDHVLVDEYQDTNRLQSAILKALKPSGQGVTVVGDDAQSIYSFRGATVRNILDFPTDFAHPARIVTLERNYRSTQPILDVSNAVIAQARERHAKVLWTDKAGHEQAQLVMVDDEATQARFVAERVLAHREAGLPLKSQAVLFRTSSHSAALELELMRRNIPFVKFGGLKFLETAHIKDVLALLRLVQNPRGRIAGLRVLQLMPGIGPATASKLLEQLAQAPEPAKVIDTLEVPSHLQKDWRAFVEVFQALSQKHLPWPADLELARRWYAPHLERLHDDATMRIADLEQLERMAAGYGSRERFLTELTLDPPEASGDLAGAPHRDEDYLILSTIHSAKGQEWKSVHVLNVVDGCMPSDLATGDADDLEEERRLLYVAMTRARDHLHLVVPHRFYVTQQSNYGDRHLYAPRSRFVTDEMLKQFDVVNWPPLSSNALAAMARLGIAPKTPNLAVRDRARSAWK